MSDQTVAAARLSAYRGEVDQALVSICGVAYSTLVEMAPALDPNGEFLLLAAARGTNADKFASAFQRVHDLSLVERERVPGWADACNRYKAAVVGFGSTERGWKVGNDGRAYLPLEDGGALRLTPSYKRQKWGFAVSESVEPVALAVDPGDAFKRVARPDTEFRELTDDVDIGEVVGNAVRLRFERQMSAEVAAEGASAPRF